MSVSPEAGILAAWFNNKDFYSSAILKSRSLLIKSGQSRALDLFRSASTRVPAYKKHLKQHHIRPGSIKSFSDFSKIPPVTKENYIAKFPLTQRCWDGKLSGMHMVSTSSGTTGQTHFWPRSVANEIDGAYIHELIFDQIFDTRHKNTLLVNGFAMGNWIAGTFTQACTNLVAWKGHKLTITTPGYSLDNVLEVLTNLSPLFDQTIITGHNPFLKEIVDTGTERGLKWKSVHPKFLGTGQAVTESWRQYILKLTGSTDYYRTFINLYGSADASLMGFETPASIFLRQYASTHGSQQQLFHDSRIPSVCAYDPRLTYIESVGNELCITKNSGCPLIRYNIHDEGGVLLKNPISVTGLSGPGSAWQLPLVYLYGRSKFMTKIYGANIYTEHVQMAVDHARLQPYLTGRFIMDSDYDSKHNPRLLCRVELNQNLKSSAQIASLVRTIFIEQVSRINSEYRYVMENMGNKVKPKIFLHRHADAKYFPSAKVTKTA